MHCIRLLFFAYSDLQTTSTVLLYKMTAIFWKYVWQNDSIYLHNSTSLLVVGVMGLNFLFLVDAILTKRQKKIVWVHYKIKRSDKNTSDSTSDIKCKDKGLLSQYLALTKDGWEGRNSARTVCWFFLQKKKSPSFFPSIYQAIKTRPCYNSERGIPPCCYTQSNVG